MLEDYTIEQAVAVFWFKLNSVVEGLTDFYEPCMLEAGKHGLLEYYLQAVLPLILADVPQLYGVSIISIIMHL